MDGWVKLHRKMLENPIVFKDADHVAVWVYLLLSATHVDQQKTFNGRKITLKPGQLISGRKVISEVTKVNESKVRRIIKTLKNDQQIDQLAGTKNSLFTVLNWDKYQSSDQQNDQRVTNKRPTSDQQVTTNKNIKNIKNERNNTYTCAFDEFWKVYPRKIDKGGAYKKWKARLNDGYTEETLIESAKCYADECTKLRTDKQYIKHPKTFLGDAMPFIDYIKKEADSDTRAESKPVKSLTEIAIERGLGEGEFEGF